DLVVVDRDGRAVRLAKRAQDQKIAERLRHAQARGDRARLEPGLGFVLALSERLYDRRAPRALDRHEPRQLRPDPADRRQLLERFPHADETDPAAGRIDDDVRHTPSELLGQLEAHGLLALDAIR